MVEDKLEGGIGHPMAERPAPSFLKQTPKALARDAGQGQVGHGQIGPSVPRDPQVQPPRDMRDIRELAQRIDSLMFEIIDRLNNLNEWLGQVPKVK